MKSEIARILSGSMVVLENGKNFKVPEMEIMSSYIGCIVEYDKHIVKSITYTSGECVRFDIQKKIEDWNKRQLSMF